MVTKWVLLGIVLYFFLFFLLPLLFLPGFIGKRNIETSPEIRHVAKKLRKNTKEATLRSIFKYVQGTYSSERHLLLLLLHKHFYKKIGKILGKKQFLPCHVQSLVFITLLLNIGQFSKKDIQRKTQMSFTGFIHQYYLVKMGKTIYKADPFYNILRKLL